MKFRLSPLVTCFAAISFAQAQDFSESISNESGSDADFGAVFMPEAQTWKDWLRPSISAAVMYDDNILLTDKNAQSDIVSTLSPSLAFSNDEDASNYWAFAYTPTGRVFADHSEFNGTDHNITGSFRKQLPKTTLGGSARYNKTSGASRFASGFADMTFQTANVSVNHVLTGKMILNGLFNYNDTDFDAASLVGRTNYKLQISALYELTPKINIGPYVSYLEEYPEIGLDQESNAGGVGFDYRLTSKIAASGSIGVDKRSFSGANTDDQTNLTYTIGLKYSPTLKTTVGIDFYQTTQTSYASSSLGLVAFDTNGMHISATHQFTSRIMFFGNLIYDMENYYSMLNANNAVAFDANFFSLNVGAKYQYNDMLSINSSVTYRESDRSLSGSFDNFQWNLGATMNF